jgi:hypothetical protein
MSPLFRESRCNFLTLLCESNQVNVDEHEGSRDSQFSHLKTKKSMQGLSSRPCFAMPTPFHKPKSLNSYTNYPVCQNSHICQKRFRVGLCLVIFGSSRLLPFDQLAHHLPHHRSYRRSSYHHRHPSPHQPHQQRPWLHILRHILPGVSMFLTLCTIYLPLTFAS